MNIDVTYSLAVKLVALDVAKHFISFGYCCRRQLLEQFQNQCAIRQASAGNFAHYERVHDYFVAFKQSREPRISPAQMVDPYRCVDENQDLILCRRRGATFRLGWLPPSLASRLALSRSMRALRPSCSNVERSSEPVNLMALAIRLSSRFTVVRIENSPIEGINNSIG
jgi:hypothetical protein